jgi:tetratricopeptide (TPR) repeat protein
LRRALALRVERPGVYFNLGGALEGQGKLPAAVAAYRRAIAIDSTYARAYYNLALLNEASSNEDEAVAAYRDFLRHWRGAPLFQREAEKRLQVLLARRGVH